MLNDHELNAVTLKNVGQIAFMALLLITITLGTSALAIAFIEWADRALGVQGIFHDMANNQFVVVSVIAGALYAVATATIARETGRIAMLVIWMASLEIAGISRTLFANALYGANIPVFHYSWSALYLPTIVVVTWIVTRLVVASSQSGRHPGWID